MLHWPRRTRWGKDLRGGCDVTVLCGAGLLALSISSAPGIQPSDLRVWENPHTSSPEKVSPKAAEPLTDRQLRRQTWTVPTWLPTLAEGYLLFVPDDEAPLLPVFLRRGVAPG